ncbi:MAG: hypothetical protein WDW38_001075 [Sanguina aurantia]
MHIRATPSLSFCRKERPPLVCAHGGDTETAPPNTARSFHAAIAGGADCVEIDAARTKDGKLVVLHVRELAQLLGAKATPRVQVQVGDMTLAQLRALRWPGGGDSILTVEEAVAITSPLVSSVILDVKTYQDQDGSPVDEEVLAQLLVQLCYTTQCSNCLVWAKSDVIVQRIKELSPGQRVGFIVMNETAEAVAAGMHLPLRMLEPEVVGMHHAMVDTEMVQLLHEKGKRVLVWTINQPQLMHYMLDVGVDALVTNFPPPCAGGH